MTVLRTAERAFDFDVPVVIVGAGAAGLTAALAARDAGAEVLLLERDAHPRGSTSMSQGYACAAGTKIQRDKGIVDDPDKFYADIMARTKGTADPLTARTVADQSGPTVDWLVERHVLRRSVPDRHSRRPARRLRPAASISLARPGRVAVRASPQFRCQPRMITRRSRPPL